MVENFPEIKYDIVVVGGGPAGICAAIFAARNGAEVAIVEKNASLGRKLCITGKGRCNITNSCDREEFFRNVPENTRFMYSSFSSFSNSDLAEFIESLGVKTVTERGGRVFPVSQNAKDVRDALKEELRRLGVKIYYGTEVTEILTENGAAAGVSLSANGMKLHSKAVIVATGGMSYPLTGSTGDGYVFAEKTGHSLIPVRPALVGVDTKEKFVNELAGLTLKNAGIRFVLDGGKVIYEDFGELLFTHTGVSGPTVLSGSFFIDFPEKRNVKIVIDLKPALDNETLDRRLLRDLAKYHRRDFANALDDLLPKSLIPVFVGRTGIDPGKKVSGISKSERLSVVSLMKNFTLTVSRLRPVDEAIITMGGVDVKDIDPKTMGSKLVKGLYFAGEVLSVTGYTGGFNLTIAFSTGHAAGLGASSQVLNLK